jgi:DegV family protein with EDD domain
LLALVAAEAAAGGASLDEIAALVESLVPLTLTMAIPDDLEPAVRGGRVPAWLGRLARLPRITPIIVARDGRIAVAGARLGRGADPASLARRVLSRLKDGTTYRIMVSHANNRAGAEALRRLLLEGHTLVHSCHVAEAGPALGVHIGPGGLIVGVLPQPESLK